MYLKLSSKPSSKPVSLAIALSATPATIRYAADLADEDDVEERPRKHLEGGEDIILTWLRLSSALTLARHLQLIHEPTSAVETRTY